MAPVLGLAGASIGSSRSNVGPSAVDEAAVEARGDAEGSGASVVVEDGAPVLRGVAVEVAGASLATSVRSSVGRGVPTTQRLPPVTSSTVSEIRMSPAWVGTVTVAVLPFGPSVRVLTVGPVMTTRLRGRAAITVSPGLLAV